MTVRMSDLPAEVQGRVLARVRGRGEAGVTTAARRAGGRRAQRAGEGFEDVVMAAALRAIELLELERLPKCGARFVGKGRIHHQPIPCDFIGATRSGRGIFFDVKHIGPGVGGLRLLDERIVKAHQRTFLHRMSAAGAIAGLMIEHEGDVLWLDGGYLANWATPLRLVKWGSNLWMMLGKNGVNFRFLLRTYEASGGQS